MLKGGPVGKWSREKAFLLRQTVARHLPPKHPCLDLSLSSTHWWEQTCSPNKNHLNVPSCCAYLCLTHSSLDLLRAQPLYVLSLLPKLTCPWMKRPGPGLSCSAWRQPPGSLRPAWDIASTVADRPLSCRAPSWAPMPVRPSSSLFCGSKLVAVCGFLNNFSKLYTWGYLGMNCEGGGGEWRRQRWVCCSGASVSPYLKETGTLLAVCIACIFVVSSGDLETTKRYEGRNRNQRKIKIQQQYRTLVT